MFKAANWALIATVGLSAWVACQRNLSFLILFIAVPAILFQGIQCLRFVRNPKQHAPRISTTIIVIVSVLIVYGVHVFRNYSFREKSEQLVEAIEKFHISHDRYPKILADVNVDNEALRIHGLYYHLTGSTPTLVYDATFIPGDYWLYDFSAHQWRYVAP